MTTENTLPTVYPSFRRLAFVYFAGLVIMVNGFMVFLYIASDDYWMLPISIYLGLSMTHFLAKGMFYHGLSSAYAEMTARMQEEIQMKMEAIQEEHPEQ